MTGALHINYLRTSFKLPTYVNKSKMVMLPNKDMSSTDESSAVLENVGSSDVCDAKMECETTFNNCKYNNCKTNVFNGNLCMLFRLTM